MVSTLGFYGSGWFNEYNLNTLDFYLRYVDDILVVVDNEQDSLNFLDFFNKRYLNIKLLIKNKLNIPFLFLMYSSQVLIIKVLPLKHITNRPMQVFS